jgi:hypothetical protein
MRLACLYAALDRSPVVSLARLQAALTMWRYSEASVGYVSGDHTDDPTADGEGPTGLPTAERDLAGASAPGDRRG